MKQFVDTYSAAYLMAMASEGHFVVDIKSGHTFQFSELDDFLKAQASRHLSHTPVDMIPKHDRARIPKNLLNTHSKLWDCFNR